MTTEAYQCVIDTLEANEIDWRKFAVEVGKICPDIFVRTVECIAGEQEQTDDKDELILLIRAVRHRLSMGNKVDAIKLVRDCKDVGLREAKAFVDALSTISVDHDQP